MRKGWGLLLLLVLGACSTTPPEPAAQRVVSTPDVTANVDVDVDLPEATRSGTGDGPSRPPRTFASTPTPAPSRKPTPPPPTARLAPFNNLGTWIDVFDHTADPASLLPHIDAMDKRGVKTLYLETARFSSQTDIQFEDAVGAALDRAKALGLNVVAWYPPDFADVKKDLKRSIAAIEYTSPEGNRFDAFAADIEYTQGVPDHAERNGRAIDYSKRLRSSVAKTYPLAIIVIPPTSLEKNPDRWPDFPWQRMGDLYDVVMPMNYWTGHGKNPETAQALTTVNIVKTKELSGRPVHIIGGLGEDVDNEQAAAYVKAARAAGSLGGGLYDFKTTHASVWDDLRKLN